VYGKDIKSISITVAKDAFIKVYAEAGETGLVELTIGSNTKPVLIHTVQKGAVKGEILHVEFYQVNLKQKVKTNVPLEFTGEAPAVLQKVGVLLTLLDEVEVEALPTDLPEKLSVDVSKLDKVDAEVKVGDLSIPKEVTVLTNADQAVVRVGALISKEAETQAAVEAAEAVAKAAAAAPAAVPPESGGTAPVVETPAPSPTE
jgi:large subunit ribosomal protein L25